jgi:hypothetical protein
MGGYEMYCRICGNSIKENAANCYVCGAPVIIRKDDEDLTEIIYNADGYDKKAEDQPRASVEDQSASSSLSGTVSSTQAESSTSEFSWNIHDFSKPGKPAEPEEFIWDIEAEKFELPKAQPEAGEPVSHDIDKFFTFSQKSEEFQKLLDKEYEKIQRSADERNALSSQQLEPEQEPPAAASIEEITDVAIEEIADESVDKEDNRAGDQITTGLPHGDMADPRQAALMEAARREYFEQEGGLVDDYEDDDDDHRSSWGFGKSLIAFILLIIVIEMAMLGIKYFLPESEAAAVIGDFQINVTKTVGQLIEAITGDEDTPPNEDDPVITTEPAIIPDPVVKSDPLPMADKAALIATQAGSNSNIKELKANSQLAYDKETVYKISDIVKSEPIKNNIWYTKPDGTTVYFDQAVVGTVIAFDSKWIDFVNNKNQEVLTLTKEDSQAYQNIENFSKAGQIQEEFLLLEIGEIRQSATGFYIWTHESIKVIENGKTTIKDYKWVYQLESIGQEMKIVNYCKF